jgi:hypothetical protein
VRAATVDVEVGAVVVVLVTGVEAATALLGRYTPQDLLLQ